MFICAIIEAISSYNNDPVNPYIKEMPKRRNPDDIAPRIQYLIAASAEKTDSLLYAMIVYKESDNNSIPRYNINK